MEVSGVELIPASPEAVWNALNDAQVLKACIPGCEAVERTSETEFRMVMNTAVGPVKARFTGKLAISEAQPPSRCIMSFEGSGGAAGFGKGGATVSLAPTSEGTELKYVATAQVGGKIAQVGSRLIDGVARKMAGDFFGRFSARFPPRVSNDLQAELAQESPATGDRYAPAGATSRNWVWIAGAVVAALILGAILLAR